MLPATPPSPPKSLNVMCWNVRNLSNTIFRQGISGRGATTESRADAVINHIHKSKSDIVFLLETGSDAKKIFKKKLLHEYEEPIISDVTGDETYVLFMKKTVSSYVLKKELIGDEEVIERFRKAWLVNLGYSDKTLVSFCVFHAPSPSHKWDEVSKPIFQNVIEKLPKNHPVIFCGDLNIKSDKFSSFEKEFMHPLGFVHKGPFDKKRNPKPTSFRLFTTQIKGGGSDSQPYDQFWINKKGGLEGIELKDAKVIDNVSMPTVTIDNLERMLGDYVSSYQEKIETLDFTTRSTTIQSTIKAGLEDQINYFLKTRDLSLRLFDNPRIAELQTGPLLKNYLIAIRLVFDFILEKKLIKSNPPPDDLYDVDVKEQFFESDMRNVKHLLLNFNPSMDLIFRYEVNKLGYEINGEDISSSRKRKRETRTDEESYQKQLTNILNEYQHSDHRPISIDVTLSK